MPNWRWKDLTELYELIRCTCLENFDRFAKTNRGNSLQKLLHRIHTSVEMYEVRRNTCAFHDICLHISFDWDQIGIKRIYAQVYTLTLTLMYMFIRYGAPSQKNENWMCMNGNWCVVHWIVGSWLMSDTNLDRMKTFNFN